MEQLLHLIRTELHIDEPIEAKTPLISSGIIDSFDVVALLSVIERHYGVEIHPESIDVESFDTPAHILNRIESTRT